MCFPSKKQNRNFSDDAPVPLRNGPARKSNDSPITAAATSSKASPRIAIIIYTLGGHIAKMAESVKAGVAEAGGHAEIFQVPETLSQEILTLMRAPPRPDYPIMTVETLPKFDGYLLGVPTRFGNMPNQWKTFWDSTGGLWTSGALSGKFAGVFVSTSTVSGGQEMTIASMMSTFVHHGINFVPLGYKHAFPQQSDVDEVHGGSPWGAGTIAAPDNQRQPSDLELDVAKKQGIAFHNVLSRYEFD
ncbi:hypothetical protein APHAL10511_003271 [Amanita phalloides]|nr:hypothetical protein APHAL10511_003271 [Amanita phalloides]